MSGSPSVEEFVVSAVAAACNVEKAAVTLDTSMLGAGLDSLHIVVLAGQIGSAYECEMTPEQMVELFEALCVRDVVQLVERVIAGRAIAGEDRVRS